MHFDQKFNNSSMAIVINLLVKCITTVVNVLNYEVRKYKCQINVSKCFLRLSVYGKIATECMCVHVRERKRQRT